MDIIAGFGSPIGLNLQGVKMDGLGEPLEICSIKPMTGVCRDGF